MNLKFQNLQVFLQPSMPVTAIASRLTTSSEPARPPSYLPHTPQMQLSVHNSARYKFTYLFTYLDFILHTAEPSYLSELISHYAPTRTLRSANTGLLALPTGVTSHFSSRSFSVSSPSVWNSLPAHVRSIDNLCTFPVSFHCLVTLCQRL